MKIVVIYHGQEKIVPGVGDGDTIASESEQATRDKS